MIVHVEVEVPLTIRRKRKRNLDAAFRRAEVAIEIPELRDLVNVATLPSRVGTSTRTEDLFWTGETGAPSFWVERSSARGETLVEQVADLMASRKGFFRIRGLRDDVAEFEDVVDVHEDEAAFENLQAEVVADLARYAVHDGRIVERIQEPALVLDSYYDRTRYVSYLRMEWAPAHDRAEVRYDLFNLAELDRVCEVHSIDDSGRERFEVRRPDVFLYDHASARLAWVATSLLSSVECHLKEMDVATFAFFAEARDILKAWREGAELDAHAVVVFFGLADATAHLVYAPGVERERLTEAVVGTRFEASVPAPTPTEADLDMDAVAGMRG